MPLKRTPHKPSVHLGPRLTSIKSDALAERLAKAMPYIPAGSQNFARSLVQNHESYSGWTPKQLAHAELLLERAREAYAEQHAIALKVKTRTEPPLRVSEDGMRGLQRLFSAAMEYTGGKGRPPAIRVQTPDELRVTIKASRVGTGFVLFDRDTEGGAGFLGGLKTTGLLDLRPRVKEQGTAIADAISRLGADPVRAAKVYAKLTHGNCCFCGKDLTDKRSKAKSYGPICASKYNLPWGE